MSQSPHRRTWTLLVGRKRLESAALAWVSLLKKDGDELEVHYRHILEKLGAKPGMLGEIFKKARQEIQNPATLKRLIVVGGNWE